MSNERKKGHTAKLVGCSRLELKAHIEKQLIGEETIEAVHLDHIFPISMYMLDNAEKQKRACHFSNLQPLPEMANKSKRDKLPTKAMAAKVARWAWPDGVTEDMLPDIYDGWATPLRMRASE